MENGLITTTEEGTPRAVSLLLSNIYLNEFDQVLENLGHKFVRYADDCNIYVEEATSRTRVMKKSFILEEQLKLTVNREKSAVEAH